MIPERKWTPRHKRWKCESSAIWNYVIHFCVCVIMDSWLLWNSENPELLDISKRFTVHWANHNEEMRDQSKPKPISVGVCGLVFSQNLPFPCYKITFRNHVWYSQFSIASISAALSCPLYVFRTAAGKRDYSSEFHSNNLQQLLHVTQA